MSDRTQANAIRDYIIDEAKSMFNDNQDIRIVKLGLLDLAIVDKSLFVKFKKLSNDLTASNQQTNQVRRFNSQELLFGEQPFLPGIVEDALVIKENYANINLGYILNETSTSIASLHATCPMNETKNRWDFTFYANGNVNTYEDQTMPETNLSKQKGYKVDVKNHMKEGKTDE